MRYFYLPKFMPILLFESSFSIYLNDFQDENFISLRVHNIFKIIVFKNVNQTFIVTFHQITKSEKTVLIALGRLKR